MKIDKAIEILDLNVPQRSPQMPPDVLDALKLSIEALNRLLTLRSNPMLSPQAPLPSEDTRGQNEPLP